VYRILIVLPEARMSRPAPTQVAPGVHRLGDHSVNFYLIEDPDGLILIDAGLPAHREELRGLLAGLGRSPADVRAVLLTHGHLDHTGLAHTLQQAGATIWIHQQDAAMLRDGPRSGNRHAKPERSMLPTCCAGRPPSPCPSSWPARGASPLPLSRTRGPSTRIWYWKISRVRRRSSRCPATRPAAPHISSPTRGLLFTGDALVTQDQFSGRTGPALVSRCFTHDSRAALAALDRLDELTADLLLPGHGAPFTDGIRTATGQARLFGAH
jgi:glyoxylase-like metal-dependent hydrolase (beta-lactamase superfamily II)